MHKLKNACMNKLLKEISQISILQLLNQRFKKPEPKNIINTSVEESSSKWDWLNLALPLSPKKSET